MVYAHVIVLRVCECARVCAFEARTQREKEGVREVGLANPETEIPALRSNEDWICNHPVTNTHVNIRLTG